MTSFDAGTTLAERFRAHAGDSTHLYGHAMRAMADDWEAGGPVRTVCAPAEDAPAGAAIQLRLLAGVFRIVLSGRAPELRPYYPCLGGGEPPEAAWPHLRQVIGAHVAELQQALEVAPQTNEVGRCAALLAGLFDLVGTTGRRRIVLLELGASAGLNLLLDRYALSGDDWSYGDAASPVRLTGAIIGPVNPQWFAIVRRRGCDLHPVDVASPAGQLLLTSFVWPFDVHRHERLAAALQVAQVRPPVVDQASAGDWLDQQLSDCVVDDDELVVVWQSITQLYWPADEIQNVRQVLEDHGRVRQLGHVAMEFSASGPRTAQPEVTTALWTYARESVQQRVLGTAHDHGVPVRLT